MAEWSLVLAITVVVVAVRVIIIAVNNLTKEGVKIFYACRVIPMNSEEFTFCLFHSTTQCVLLSATHIETSVTFVHLKATTLHNLEPRKLPSYAFDNIFQC